MAPRLIFMNRHVRLDNIIKSVAIIFFFCCPFIFYLATILLHFQELFSSFAQYARNLATYLLTSVITHELTKWKHKLRTIRIKKSTINKENGVNTNFKPDINKLSTNKSCIFLKNLPINFEISAQYLIGQFDLDFLSDIHFDQKNNYFIYGIL
jgi:hypothetical protein